MKDRLEYFSLRLLVGMVTALPFGMGCRLADWVGSLLFWVDRKHRRIAELNLSMAFPEKSSEERRRIAQEHFRHIARNAVEFMWLGKDRLRILRTVVMEGREHIEKAKADRRGIVLILPHLGNWEIVGALYPTLIPTATIAFPQTNPFSNEFVDGIRKASGLEVIPTGVAVRRVLERLREGYLVGFLADQDAGQNGIFVNFFGRPTSTAKGPAAFARKTGAAMHVTYIVRQEDGRHRMTVLPEIPVDAKGEESNDELAITQRWSTVVEQCIRRHPEQWFWVHRRWKTVPDGEPYPYEGI